MGMDQKVIFPSEKTPPWQKLIDALAGRNLLVQMRMIDGELAFPDETPPDAWRELRVAASGSMVSLRREKDGITLVIWGNADLPTRQTWNALAWTLAQLTGGRIHTAAAELALEEFARTAEMPDGW